MGDGNKRTTMSVPEMRRMLGLGKTDSYWLIHKHCFETISVNGRIRIVIDSFEKWYANQVKHKKVDGPPPGAELREYSYSPQEIAELLGIDDASVYYLIKRDHIPVFYIDTWMRIRKEVFDTWYRSQEKHRTREDRERDAQLEESSLTLPDAARELGIDRREGYAIFNAKRNRGIFEYVIVAGRRRVTKESFDKWYRGQSRYIKISDLPEEQRSELELKEKQKEFPVLIVDPDKKSYRVAEAAVLMNLQEKEVRSLIKDGEIKAIKLAGQYRIDRDEISWWVMQQKKFRESEV